MDGKEKKNPDLSLILCSRNDSYMGNSRWRLETTLNYLAKQIEALSRTDDVEILVADWGSEVPLREVLQLTPATSRLVSFIWVPPEIARPLQKDSPFPEVLALNAAARRANGKFVGRIDQDTLVGRRFLEVFFDLYEGRRQIEVPLESALLFSNVRLVPYRLAVRCPPLSLMEQFIDRFGNSLALELAGRRPFYKYGVGIWLLSRSLWHECGGYDESMIYMNAMEINMIDRLIKKYPIVNLGEMVDYDFYHLEHYHPCVPRRSSVYRKDNPENGRLDFRPNDANWGLGSYSLPVDSYPCAESTTAAGKRGEHSHDELRLTLLLLLVSVQSKGDALMKKFFNAQTRWRRWLPILVERWRSRSVAQ